MLLVFPRCTLHKAKYPPQKKEKKKNPNRSKFANSFLKKPNESSNYSQLNREDTIKFKKKLKKSDTEKAKTTFSGLILSHMRRESDPDFILLFFFPLSNSNPYTAAY